MSGNKISRRDLLRGGALAAAGSVLAACQTKTVEVTREVEKVVKETVMETVVEKETVVVEVPQEMEPVTLEFWSEWSDPTRIWLEAMAEDFTSRHPNITINLSLQPGGGDYQEFLLTRIAAGEPPSFAHSFDAAVVFGARGAAYELNDLMATAEYAQEDAYWPLALKTCKWRGKVYGLPFSTACYLIYYNVDAFEEKGISTAREDFPTTWDDMRALSQEFLEWDGDELKSFGIVPWNEQWHQPSWMGSNGSPGYFSQDDELYTINHPLNVETLEYWVRWLDEDFRGDWEYLSTLDPSGPRSPAMKSGQQSFGIDGSWSVGNAGMAPGTVPFNWEVVRFPLGPDGTQTKAAFWPNWFFVPAGSPHPEEGFLATEYYTTIGHNIHFLYHYEQPTGWKNFDRNKVSAQFADWYGVERARELNNYFIEYVEDGAAEMWTSPIESFANDQIGAALDEILFKQKTPQQALDDAQKIVQARFEEEILQS
jgi:ABC-type glycerol-3-phosphate transport system substrate-binding protein